MSSLSPDNKSSRDSRNLNNVDMTEMNIEESNTQLNTNKTKIMIYTLTQRI